MVPQVPCVGCGVMGSPTCLGPVRWPPTVKVSVLGEGSPLTCYVNLSSAHSEPRQAHASTVPRRHAHSRAVWLFQIRLMLAWKHARHVLPADDHEPSGAIRSGPLCPWLSLHTSHEAPLPGTPAPALRPL